MKFIKSILLFCVVGTVVSGCAKEQFKDKSQERVCTVLNVGMPQEDARTAISEPSGDRRTVTWIAGDVLNLNGTASDPLADQAAGKTHARFTWNGVLSTPYKLLYPSSFWKDASTITLPFSQNKMPGNDDLATDTLPLCGYASSDGNVDMKHICAIVKVQWTENSSEEPDNDVITYVEFRGNNSEQVSGDFSIDYANASISGISSNELSKSVRAFSIKETESSVKVCNIVVPAGTYSKGFTVRLVDGKGHYMDKKTTASKTLAPGEVAAMPAIKFTPTDKLDALCIKSAEELIAFAKDWNANKFEGNNANVSLMSDIVFNATTSAEFVATGGIGCKVGDDDIYYNGTFSGNGFSIKGLVSDVPIFSYTGAGAKINDLVLDASCKFTCTSKGRTDYGPLAGRFKGNMSGCVNKADITVETNALTSARYIGGFVGRSYEGTLDGCTMKGTVKMGAGTNAAAAIYIGGIAGRQDGKSASKMKMLGCTMDGKVILSDGSEVGGPVISGQYIYIGGMAGEMVDGTISGCSTTENAVITCNGQYKNNIGGIIGHATKGTVSECDNRAAIFFASDGARAETTPTYIGGIVGQNGKGGTAGADISNCHNYGAVSTLCNSTTVGLGGVAGYNNGNMYQCINDGAVTRTSQTPGGQTNRYVTVGGVAGTFEGGNATQLENNGVVESDLPAASTNTTTAIGGVIGRFSVSTTSKVTSCSNYGSVHENGGSDITVMTSKAYGGIIGLLNTSCTISDCTNAGKVHCQYNTKASRGSCTGGIVGAAALYSSGWTGIKNTSISSCTNYGEIYAQAYSNEYNDIKLASVGGGIVGLAIGTSGSKLLIDNCTNSDNLNPVAYNNKSGYQGGIAGYADNVTVSNCVSSKASGPYSSNIPRYSGGIVGKLVASTVSGCDANKVNLHASSSAACDMGGIAGAMDGTSTISNCNVIDVKLSYNATSNNFKYGAVAGTTVAGAKINNCLISGGWSVDDGGTYTPFVIGNVASDTNFTGTGNKLGTVTYDLTGTVKCGSTPLVGVVVSDGLQSVVTDSEGKYYMNTSKDKDATCVAVSIPSGYMPTVSGGLASFYKKLSGVSAVSGVKTVNFSLNKISSNVDKYTVIAYADVQIRPSTGGSYGWYDNIAFRSIDIAKDFFTDVNDFASTVTGSNLIGLSLGDQIHKDVNMYNTYKSASMLGKLSFPNFCTIGNHDYDPTATDYVSGAKKYEENLAPVRYSFNIGKYHVIVVDNTRTKYEAASGAEVSETKGLPDPAWQWLQSDLKYVPASTPIIICSHNSLFMEIYSTDKRERDMSTRDWALNTGYSELLQKYKKVIALNGHLHTAYNYVYPSSSAKKNIKVHSLARSTGELWTNQYLSSCGTPRGFVVFEIDGDDYTYKFHPAAHQTASLASGPGSMPYRDYSVSSGVFYMKSGKMHSGAKLDDFYQLHAYAPGASDALPDKILANVFMYNRLWSDVMFEYSGGSVKMEQIPVSEAVMDPGYIYFHKYYKANSSLKSDSGYALDFCNYNIFRCDPPSGVTSGNVKVTDEFGETYSYPLSW